MKRVVFGFQCLRRLPRMLERCGLRRAFLVTGRRSFELSGAAAVLSETLGNPSTTTRFCDFSENPKLEDVQRGIEAIRLARPDVVIAVGGGSAIDMAKLVNALGHQSAAPLDVVEGRREIQQPGVPLVAIPTTAGSGSEATHFAVVYVQHRKYSVASPALLPTLAVVDPALTMSLSPALTAVTGIDAFAQAVESYWAVQSTDESKVLARRAIALVLGYLPTAVHAPTPRARRAMSKAAHLAGCAINISKTTGPHALSYALTSHFGIPHGHAVGLTLGRWLLHNSQVNARDVTDPRGVAHVTRAVGEIVEMIGAGSALEGCDRIEQFLQTVGLPNRLGAMGISRSAVREAVMPNVNVERLGNNPRASTPGSLWEIVEAVC